MRCLTLADGLRGAGVMTDFLLSEPASKIRDLIEARGFVAQSLNARPGTAVDASETAALSRACAASLVIVDGYQFRGDYLAALDTEKLMVCFIDDMGDLRYECAAILNHNLYAKNLAFDVRPGCDLLLGPEFALVRDEFCAARSEKVEPRQPADRVLITMGGSDPTAAAPRVIEALSPCGGPLLAIRVLVGAVGVNDTAVDQAAAASKRHTVTVLRDANVAEQMLWCDIAIAAAGVTCMELACVGVPAIALAVAENQRLVAHELGRLGLMRTVPDIPAIPAAFELLRGDLEARVSMARAQRATVDGEGKRRAAERLVAALGRFAC